MPFKLESFSAPRTRVVHVHHHHYSDSVHDSSEDDYEEDDYEEDNYEEDNYEEFKFSESNSESEFSGEAENGSDSLFTTSCDEDSSYSGYEESSY